MQHDRNMTVSVTKATALNQTAAAGQPSIHIGAFDETSLAHFCAFMDFYTRQCHDPFSTSLTCAKQAEVVQITPEDLTPETMRQVIQTMLSVVDHLEKKWLDEQIQHEERMQRHRDDVARLSQQLRVLQSVPSVKGSFARRGLAWLQDVISRPKISRVRHASRKPGVKRRHALAA